MVRSATCRSLLLLHIVGSVIYASSARTCTSQNFTNKIFGTCIDLPVLNASLHWTYYASNGTVDVAYRATPASGGDWVAWAINPTGQGMVGSQAIVGYVFSDSVNVITTSVVSYTPSMRNGSLSFPVSKIAGEVSGGDIILFATLSLPSNTSTVHQVWQTGPMSERTPSMHPTTGANLLSMGTLDLISGHSTSTSDGDTKTRRKK
ncbi:cytochrome b561 and DOMON domain-containing protein At5g47530-like isoform X2 [Nymphaea colorata]|nr:cytochrome b561 and DOMON domain-containing protein At5g47530-like isoform X2 [Nymphaea colorata]